MQNEAVADARSFLSSALREFREVMDETQSMYYHLFIRTLTVQQQLQSAMCRLQDAKDGEQTT